MSEQELFQRILGDVVANEEYGLVMKKWRELFSVTQAEIAGKLDVKPSVISDYENSRRRSPGIVFIRSYVNALIVLGELRNKDLHDSVKKELDIKKANDNLIIKTFNKPKNNSYLIKLLRAKPVTKTNSSAINGLIFFHDNISRVLMKLPTYKLLNEMKKVGSYAYIFSNVKSGNLPLILLTLLSKINKTSMPALVIFQSDSFKPSNFSKKTAEKKNITLAVTGKDVKDIKKIIEKMA
ncbi:Uncharacterised protein [Candidatus Tiddalikarchaeum anstoanum]|nr:Uncharacterised protein [Candidatus Tiddalikarchaeum anstoanum]